MSGTNNKSATSRRNVRKAKKAKKSAVSKAYAKVSKKVKAYKADLEKRGNRIIRSVRKTVRENGFVREVTATYDEASKAARRAYVKARKAKTIKGKRVKGNALYAYLKGAQAAAKVVYKRASKILVKGVKALWSWILGLFGSKRTRKAKKNKKRVKTTTRKAKKAVNKA